MSILSVREISRKDKKIYIYQGISVEIEKGDCYALIGADNEGKTSILNAILGLDRISGGEILFDGRNLKTYDRLKRIGYVPDELLCFEHMTGAELLDMTIRLKKLGDCMEKAEELIEYFQVNPGMLLEDMDEDMNKCIYFISAFLSEPELLILDEPFNFLGEESCDRLKQWITDYRKRGNAVLVTHENYEGVADICTKFSVLKGKLQIRRDDKPGNYRNQKLITVRKKKGGEGPVPEERWNDAREESDSETELRVLWEDQDECFLLFCGSTEKLKKLLAELDCEDFIVEDITVQEQIFKEYAWMEE